MSTSLKVVRRALVFYASFKLAAIFIRIRLIGTRVSIRWPVIVLGAVLEVVEAVPPPGVEAGAFYGVTGGGGAGLEGAGVACIAAALAAGCSSVFGVAGAFGGGGVAAAAGADPALASVSST